MMDETRKRVREAIEDRARAIRAERESGSGLWAQLGALFRGRDLDQEAAKRVEAEREHHARRLEQNPIFFDDWSSFVRYRRSRGLRTRPRPRNEFWSGLRGRW